MHSRILPWTLDRTYCHTSMGALAAAQKKRLKTVIATATGAAGNSDNRQPIFGSLAATGLAAEPRASGFIPMISSNTPWIPTGEAR